MRRILRSILLLINLVFAVALVFSTLSGVLPPHRLEWVSVLSFCFFGLLLCNVAFIIVWLCMSRWEFLLSAAAILVRCTFVPLFFQVGGTDEVAHTADDGMLRVMTYNTHGFEGMDDDTLMSRDSGAVLFLQMIDENEPDVLCLQEFFPSAKVYDSLKSRGYTFCFSVHGNQDYTQSVILSRSPILRGSTMDKKSKFYADIAHGDHRVRVCCVHLDSYQLDSCDREGLRSLSRFKQDSSTYRLVDKLIETTRRHETEWNDELLPLVESTQIPLIVAGDFNDQPASYIYQQARKHLDDAFVDQGVGFGTTYHGLFPAFRIDFILHSKRLHTVAYKRIKSPVSDHYPIIATFTWNDE